MRRIDDVLVDLVGDDEGVVLLRELQDEKQFLAREDLAAGVGRIAEDDGLGPLREGAAQFVVVEGEIGRAQRDVDRLGAGEDRVGGVVLVEGREDDDFITWVAGGHHGDHHRLGAAAGGDEMAVGIDLELREAVDLRRERLPETDRSPSDRILVERPARTPFQRLEQDFRRIEIRKALGEIDGLMLVGEAGHFADDRFLKDREAAGGGWHDVVDDKQVIKLDKAYMVYKIIERAAACPIHSKRQTGRHERHNFAMKRQGRKNFRDALAPLQKARGPWLPSTLGTWSSGADDYTLEQYLFVGPRGGGDYLRVGIFAGVHGDELAGISAAIRFVEELARQPELALGYEIYVYPLCNPTGFEDGTRHARSGKDLNREFWLGSREPEVRLLERQIRTLRFDGLIALHADVDTSGLYAFALGAQVTQHVVEPALQAAEQVLPRNLEPTIDNFTARNGLIRKGYPGMLCAAPETNPMPFEIVLETPLLANMEKQVEANVIFLRHALEQYQQLLAVGQDL